MASNLPVDWSELVPDVLSSVYERLSFADLARAKSVCSSWYSVSTPRKNHVPWLIFKQEKNWELFDPEEGKFYRTQINHLGFAGCRSLATCGSWVLVLEKQAYFYIFNPFTSKIIRLPPLQSDRTLENKILGKYSIHFDYGFEKERFGQRCERCHGKTRSVRVKNAVLWVEERTKDYLVVWTSSDNDHLYFGMKGDQEWFETPTCEYLGGEEAKGGLDMAYKDNKLYILSEYGRIGILDFSEGFPREVPNHPYVKRRFHTENFPWARMILTTSGDVLMIQWMHDINETIGFKLYKMNNTTKDWEEVDSLDEEEALVWNLSVTLPTKGVSGIKKGSIYFCDYSTSYSEILFENASTYDIPTQRINRLGDLPRVKDVMWFLPCFDVGE